MDTNDYNLGNTVFQISFLCAELPSQMISKKLGPDRWIPFIMCSWSLVSGCQFFLSGRTSFLVCRALLGVLQGGFIPDVVLYLTYYFKSTELPFRLAMFWTVRRITDIVAPLLALGVLRMDGIHGYDGWRWLFMIEGILTLSISIWSWFSMAPSPTQTKAWWRPEGWFNEHEEKILVNRILRDDPSKCDMHNRQAITPKLLLKSLADWELWPIYVFGLIWEIPAGPPDQYLTLTLRNLGFDTNDTNLLSIPPQFLGAVFMLIMTYLSEIWDSRALFGAFTQLWYLPNLVAMAVLPADSSPWIQYAVVTVLLSYPSRMYIFYLAPPTNIADLLLQPMPCTCPGLLETPIRSAPELCRLPCTSQLPLSSPCLEESNSRTMSDTHHSMMVQLARVIYSNIYREDDRPECKFLRVLMMAHDKADPLD